MVVIKKVKHDASKSVGMEFQRFLGGMVQNEITFRILKGIMNHFCCRFSEVVALFPLCIDGFEQLVGHFSKEPKNCSIGCLSQQTHGLMQKMGHGATNKQLCLFTGCLQRIPIMGGVLLTNNRAI